MTVALSGEVDAVGALRVTSLIRFDPFVSTNSSVIPYWLLLLVPILVCLEGPQDLARWASPG